MSDVVGSVFNLKIRDAVFLVLNNRNHRQMYTYKDFINKFYLYHLKCQYKY